MSIDDGRSEKKRSKLERGRQGWNLIAIENSETNKSCELRLDFCKVECVGKRV